MNRAAPPALERLLTIADTDTGQARRVANFLLAWHNADENGGWAPTDLWNVDDEAAQDILTVLAFLRKRHAYAEELGLREQMGTVWKRWRSARL